MTDSHVFLIFAIMVLCAIVDFVEGLVDNLIIKAVKPILFMATLLMMPITMDFLFSMVDTEGLFVFMDWLKNIIVFGIF